MTGRSRTAVGAPRRSRRGFTVVELLVAIILFAIVSTGMYNLLFNQNRFFDVEEATNATQQNTRIALRRVANDIMLVGRGINVLNMNNPDVVLPNDGTVSPNVVQTDAITLLSIPDGVPNVPFAVNAAKGARSITVADDTAGVARGLTAGDPVILQDVNQSNSQVVNVTSATDGGPTVTVNFAAVDSLLVQFPAATSRLYTMNRISYRLNDDDTARPFLERRLNDGTWDKMVAGIERLSFSYFDSTSTAITPATSTQRRQIRRVRVDVGGRSVRPVDARGTRVRLDLRTDVTPRNLIH